MEGSRCLFSSWRLVWHLASTDLQCGLWGEAFLLAVGAFFAYSWASLLAVRWGAYQKQAPTVSKKTAAVSKKAPIVSKIAPIVSKIAPKHNCKYKSSIVSRKLPIVSKKLHPYSLWLEFPVCIASSGCGLALQAIVSSGLCCRPHQALIWFRPQCCIIASHPCSIHLIRWGSASPGMREPESKNWGNNSRGTHPPQRKEHPLIQTMTYEHDSEISFGQNYESHA